MTYLKLKMFLCIIVCHLFLSGPFLLDIAPGGKAYAGSRGSKRGNNNSYFITKSKAGPKNFGYEFTKKKPSKKLVDENRPIAVPEPATLLLFGAGAIGLAAFRKKIKKK